MIPVSPLFAMDKYLGCLSDSIAGGISPTNLLLKRANRMRLEQPDMFDGIPPPRELLCSQRYCNLCKLLISGGIMPVKLLVKRLNSLKKLKFPTNGEMVPVSLEELRYRATTLECR